MLQFIDGVEHGLCPSDCGSHRQNTGKTLTTAMGNVRAMRIHNWTQHAFAMRGIDDLLWNNLRTIVTIYRNKYSNYLLLKVPLCYRLLTSKGELFCISQLLSQCSSQLTYLGKYSEQMKHCIPAEYYLGLQAGLHCLQVQCWHSLGC